MKQKMMNNFNTITPEKEYHTHLTPSDEYNNSNFGGLNNWTETTLGEVCEITSSKRIFANEYKTSGIPFFRGKEVTEKFNGNKISTELFITEDKYNEIKNNFGVPEENDILLTSVGTLGNPYLVEKDLKFYFKDGNLTWFRKYNNINPKWLFYWIISPQGKEILSYAKIGSTQEAFTISKLKNLEILLPPLEEQKAIAAVLTAFDDKIELLREQNKTLEEMGQTIFQDWFIEDNTIYKQRLGDLVEVKRGGSPRPIQEFISETGYRWLKISDASATASPYIFDIKECIKEEGLKSTTLLKAGSLVLSNSATPGMPKILAVDSCIHDGWLHFPKSRFSNEFLYLLFQEIRPQLIQQGSGSVFTNLKTDILKDYEAPLPSNEMLQNFDNIIKPIFEKIFDNANQIQSLSYTRDALLPRLLRGELRVGRN